MEDFIARESIGATGKRLECQINALDRLSTEKFVDLYRLLTEYDRRYDEQSASQKVAVQAAFESAKEAVLKAEAAYEKRFEGVNEFRQQLADQQNTFISRSEVNSKFEAIDQRLESIRHETDSWRTGLVTRMTELFKGVDDKLLLIATTESASKGRMLGATSVWGYIVGAAGVGIAIAKLFWR